MIAHVDLDSFLVAVERGRNPDLKDRPVILGGQPAGRGAVAAASREARRAGVRAGMPLAVAAIRCPGAVFLDGSVDHYIDASLHVDEVLRRETPDIEWVSIDEAFLGFPSATPARAAVDAVERIHAALHAMGLDAGCGLARSKTVARIASQLAKPRGVVHVLEGYEARFLAPLKIEMLPGLDPAVAKKLRGAGVRRLGQLAQLADAQVALLTGRAGTRLTRLASGNDPSRLARTPLPPRRILDAHLPAPTADGRVVRAALGDEARRLGKELRGHAVCARGITLRIRYADGRVDSRTVPLGEPSALDEPILAAVMDAFTCIHRPERLVCAVGVACAGVLDAAGAPALFMVR